jgi:hypothetical protein
MIHDMAMYVVETIEQARTLGDHEIFDFIIDDTECVHCGMVVGPISDKFFPCVIVVASRPDDSWPLCFECAAPLLFPREWIIELDI